MQPWLADLIITIVIAVAALAMAGVLYSIIKDFNAIRREESEWRRNHGGKR